MHCNLPPNPIEQNEHPSDTTTESVRAVAAGDAASGANIPPTVTPPTAAAAAANTFEFHDVDPGGRSTGMWWHRSRDRGAGVVVESDGIVHR
ncbi:hypothetical protein VTN77DRAFT_8065 [Rasamsonia byssochlamydoides]|uniref:uncharacterized protein n=1 Tax=Rasamsonia byssochlamydoides TaxID=89139 RepID=UPI003743FF08